MAQDAASLAPKTNVQHERARRQRGQSMVEFALVLPLFLVLLFAVVDIGMGLHAYITITNAAREGARIGVVCPGGDSAAAVAEVEDAVQQRTGSLVGANVTIPEIVVPCQGEMDVRVKVDYQYEYITPLGNFVSVFSGGPLQLTSTTIMRSERSE